MLLAIIRKEILANLLSFRFTVSFLLCMILIPISAYVLKNDYKQELSNYNSRVRFNEEFLKSVNSINNVEPMCDRAPAVLSVIFKRGAFNRLVEGTSIGLYFTTDTSDPIPTLLPLFDMGAILGIILSLMAILFGYDALVAEKEGGTLKLMLSNGVSRGQVLLGKWIGGYISLVLPLAISAIVSLLIVTTDQMVSFRGSDWLALGMIFLGAMIYISIFFTLAYFISAISRSFASSALISLCVWLVLVLIVPNGSVYIASKLRPMPSIQKAQYDMAQANRKLNEVEGRKIEEFMSKPHSKAEEELFFKEKFLGENGAVAVILKGVFIERKKIRDDFDRKADGQISLAKQISAVSPYACFTYLTSTLSGTGVEAEQDLGKKGERFFPEFIQYLLDKIRQSAKSFAEINNKTDVSDMPRFNYIEQSIPERLSASLVYFLLLAIFNVVFFMAAYVAFVRSGVR